MTTALRNCTGALALELAPDTHASNTALDAADAATLGGHIAHDLATLAADAVSLDLGVLAMHFDPVELLRPGWPLHAALAELMTRAPDQADASRVIAFGTHNGQLPDPTLIPDSDYVQGPLRLIPFVLCGDAEIATRVGGAFEESLLDHGMAGAATALFAQQTFGARIEHAPDLSEGPTERAEGIFVILHSVRPGSSRMVAQCPLPRIEIRATLPGQIREL